MRVGGICQNHVNHVFVSDDKKYACGTDSGLFQCVNVQSPTERFHAKPLSKEDTVIESVETRNGQLVITAGPDGVQMSRFNTKKFDFVGEALTSPKGKVGQFDPEANSRPIDRDSDWDAN